MKPKISSLYVYDPSHFRFDRSTGLPLRYFSQERVDPDAVVVVFCVVVALCFALAHWGLGLI